MNGNFKVRCVDTKGQTCCTKDKIYEIVSGCLTDDKEEIIYDNLISIEDLQRRSLSDWELVDEKENNMSGNFKAKCIDASIYDGYYIIGKVYDVIDGVLRNDYNDIIFRGLNSFEDLEKYSTARWELVEEYKTKLTITIDDKIATISDGNDIIEVENNINNEELLVQELVKKYYYNQENNKIKVGDSVSITDTNCYSLYKEFIVENAQELIDRMGLVEFSNLLLKFKSGNKPFLNGKYEVSLIAKHPNNNENLAIISDVLSTFIINIDNLKKIKNQIWVNKYE